MGTHNKIFLIDPAMAKPYQDPKNKKRIPYGDNRPVVGTARYMSINTHLGQEQSRRDDLEGVGYVLIYFLKGRLPWQGLGALAMKEKQKYERIGKKKQIKSIKDLREGCPDEFGEYLRCVRSLSFDHWLEDPLNMAQPRPSENRKIFYDAKEQTTLYEIVMFAGAYIRGLKHLQIQIKATNKISAQKDIASDNKNTIRELKEMLNEVRSLIENSLLPVGGSRHFTTYWPS
ncbi:kinase-like domain-containing protein [Dactylonectria macrodidyma]|uniref:Kinase-like domain-containing protein n=1 Tax=Dactylonectria macrodidyma TaxID=307937 RepID=A0A9P9ITE1_9HYPO|nr:kinase-like domain-containing protein [Dactylonectria macrodidyma]